MHSSSLPPVLPRSPQLPRWPQAIALAWLVVVCLLATTTSRAAVLFSDDFSLNPTGLIPRWVATTPVGSYQILWTGSYNPSSWSSALPANASAQNLYSFSDGTQSFSTVATANPAVGWETQSYQIDFCMGGTATTLGDLSLAVVANRNGANGYFSSFSLGGDGRVSWSGCYGWSGYGGTALVKDVWYRLITDVTKAGAAITVQARIVRLSDNVTMHSSSVYTDSAGQYANPNGFRLEVGNGIGYYWNRAMQLDNFQFAATIPETVFIDDFGINPLLSPNPRWVATNPSGAYPLVWTGNYNPSSLKSSLPVNATTHNLYAFSDGARTFSTISTTNPASGWTKQSYQLDFLFGGTATRLDGMSLTVVANRSGTTGYRSMFYVGKTNRVRWMGCYGSTAYSTTTLAKNVWYRLVTDVAKAGAAITVQARIVRLSDNVTLHSSPVYTDSSGQYANPNGFRLEQAGGTGYYWTRAVQLDNFQVTADVPPPAWLNNNLGKDTSVPAPWSAVTVSGNNVNVWGRSYQFNDLGLPVGLVSQGQDLFGGTPMQVNAKVNNTALTFSATGALQIETTRPDQVVVKGTATANVSGVTLEVVSTIEFDGFVRSQIKLSGSSSLTLNQFWLDTSLASTHAQYFLPTMGNDASIPTGGMKRPLQADPEFVYFTTQQLLWVGGDDIGLFLSAEDDRTWQSANRDEAQELIPQTGKTLWRYHVVDSNRSLATPQELDFCYMATPVKPLADWTAARVSGDASYSMGNTVTEPGQPYTGTGNYVVNAAALGIRQMAFHEHWTQIMGYPGASDSTVDANLSWLAGSFQAYGMNLCLYSHPVLSDAAPEFNRWGAKWSATWPAVAGAFTRDPSFSGVAYQSVFFCSQASEWSDFYIYSWLHRLQYLYGIDGVYLDGTMNPVWDFNPNRPNAYMVNGVCRPTRPIYAAREFMKRWYKTMKGNNPDFFFLAHASDRAWIPSLSFVDYAFGGEEFWQREGRELTWSMLRAAYAMRQFGIRADLYGTGCFQEPYLVPLAAVHGCGMYGRGAANLVSAYAKPAWDAWDLFDVSTSTWVPYWKGNGNLTSSNANVKVSYYQRPNEILLVAATNLRTRPAATISINLAAFGLDPAKVEAVRLCNGTALSVTPVNGVLTLSFLDQISNPDGVPDYIWLHNRP